MLHAVNYVDKRIFFRVLCACAVSHPRTYIVKTLTQSHAYAVFYVRSVICLIVIRVSSAPTWIPVINMNPPVCVYVCNR